MSETRTDIIMRYQLGVAETVEEAISIIEPLLGKPESEDEFYFEPKGKFKASWINNKVFLDYYFVDGATTYCDLDFSLGFEEVNEVRSEFDNVFTGEQDIYIEDCLQPYVDGATLRVFQYYDGGCSGISEVE
jgi:hypothetical protein